MIDSDPGDSIDILVGSFFFSFGDVAFGSEDVPEKENGESRLERRFAGEYVEEVDVDLSSLDSCVADAVSLALEIFATSVAGVDAGEVWLSGISMLIFNISDIKCNSCIFDHIKNSRVKLESVFLLAVRSEIVWMTHDFFRSDVCLQYPNIRI